MKRGLFIIFTCFSLFMPAQSNCILKIGNMQFAQPNGSAEAFIGKNGDTTWRIRYEIPANGKSALQNAIFGAMHYNCPAAETKIKSFTLKIETGNKAVATYEKIFKSNFIVRDEQLEKIFTERSFTIYIDDIQLYSDTKVYGLAIEYSE